MPLLKQVLFADDAHAWKLRFSILSAARKRRNTPGIQPHSNFGVWRLSQGQVEASPTVYK
jgi:hypothetical protein